MKSLGLLLVCICAMGQERDMDTQCRQEIIALHQFFEDWFNGTLPNTEAGQRRFRQVMAPGFRIVAPNGGMTRRAQLFERIAQAHGIYRDESFKIWIEDALVMTLADGLFLVTYQEWQRVGNEEKIRLSSAILKQDPDAPNGLVWLHVHETWMAD